MSYDYIKKRFKDANKWNVENINDIIQCANGIGYPKKDLLNKAITRGSSKEVICQIILSSANDINELNQMKKESSSIMQKKAVEKIIIDELNTGNADFQPYILSTMILEGKQISQEIKPEVVANAAMKAIIYKPEIIPAFQELIEDFFGECDSDDIVKAALASDDGMKFILSTLVPRIMQNDPLAISILQRIAADPRGKPAYIVGSDISLKCGIKCFV